jgi:hypothetical protein
MQPNPDKTRLSKAICGGISRKTVNPSNIEYFISVHRHHGRLECAILEFYSISVQNELLASGIYIISREPICYGLLQWVCHIFVYGLTEN